MPLAPDVLLKSPLDPDHPLLGKAAAAEFLRTRGFPRIPVRKVEVERHMTGQLKEVRLYFDPSPLKDAA